jgi:hypothetical protein
MVVVVAMSAGRVAGSGSSSQRNWPAVLPYT